MTRAEVDEARREGMMAAQRLLARLNHPLGEPLDVFSVVERTPLWLLFEPLDNLFGMYQRSGDHAGIVIHSKHPVALQRFTTAHELGHHVLGHESVIDGAETIEGFGQLPLQEHAAQAFASTLLMPVQLINRLLERVGLDRDAMGITSLNAYQLAALAGVSYGAMVGELANLRKITFATAKQWRKLRPLAHKTELGAGRPPENSRGELWRLDDVLGEEPIHAYPGDELHVSLRENPSTGYVWAVATDTIGVQVVDTWLGEPHSAPGTFGGSGTRHIRLRAVAPAKGSITLQLARAQALDVPLRSHEFHVHVQMWRSGETRVGMTVPQQNAWVAHAA